MLESLIPDLEHSSNNLQPWQQVLTSNISPEAHLNT